MGIDRERRAWLTTEALARLVESPLPDQQRFLLCECVQAYAPMRDEDWRQFQELLVTDPYRRQGPMIKTMRDHILAEGVKEGIEHGQRQLLQQLIEQRFGPLSAAALERLQAWPVERLPEIGGGLLQGQSLKELGLED